MDPVDLKFAINPTVHRVVIESGPGVGAGQISATFGRVYGAWSHAQKIFAGDETGGEGVKTGRKPSKTAGLSAANST
jgi:hypothetical protein